MADADDTLAPGTVLGRYEIRRQLGRGGMGAVYEATHRDLKKRVAVKVLSRALASNEEARQRFLREGEAASRIQHPHVVDVTDVGIDGARPYLVMELLEGEDLASRLGRGGALAVREAVDILLPVCAGLSVAHEEGVIHRDLKPENIFLARRRQGGIEPKVLDFGVSKVLGQEARALTGTSATFGTPYYMPPEQLRGARQADQRSDVYALGVILYECLCGRRPFQADNIYAMLHAIGSGQYLAPRVVQPELPAAVEAVIVRAMRLDPADRPPNVRAFAVDLLPFASDTVRLLWADTFRADPGQTTPGRRQVSAFDQTVVSDSVPPASTPPAFTTLGTVTGQMGEGSDATGARRMPPLVAVIGGLAVAGGVVAVFALSRSQRPEPGRAAVTAPAAPRTVAPAAPTAAPATASYWVDLATAPPGAALELDGVAIGAAPLRRELPRDGRPHRVVARAPGREPASLDFTDRPPPSPLVLAPVAQAAPPAPEPVARSRTDKGSRPPARAPRGKRSESGSPPPPASAAVPPAVTSPPPAPAAPRPAAPAPAASGNRAPVLD
jgi:serine/threonine-protein kinase